MCHCVRLLYHFGPIAYLTDLLNISNHLRNKLGKPKLSGQRCRFTSMLSPNTRCAHPTSITTQRDQPEHSSKLGPVTCFTDGNPTSSAPAHHFTSECVPLVGISTISGRPPGEGAGGWRRPQLGRQPTAADCVSRRSSIRQRPAARHEASPGSTRVINSMPAVVTSRDMTFP